MKMKMKTKTLTTLASLSALLLATPALADEPLPEEPGVETTQAPPAEDDTPLDDAIVSIGLKVGGGFSQVFSDLGAAFVPELEVGVILPVLDQALTIFVAGQWAAPTAEGSEEADARLPGDGVMSWEVTQSQAIITFGLLFRIPAGGDLLRPYLAGGGRVYLMETEVSGAAGGEAFGTNTETATQWGGYGAAGVDFFVGPGAILVELQVGYSALDGYVMRNTNTGALNAMVGYRLML